jgi:L-fucose isomerase-like protein
MTTGALIIGRERPGFDPAWGERIHQAVRAALPHAVFADEPAIDDASLDRAIAGLRAAGCDALIVLQPTMGDGRLTPRLAQRWPDPIVLWATGENPDSDRVSACTLVGAHNVAALLRQIDHPFELVSGPPEDGATLAAVDRAVRVTATVARLCRANVRLVGDHAPGFIDLHVDPARLRRDVGVRMQRVALDALFDALSAVDDDDAKADMATQRDWSRAGEISDDALLASSRYYLAIERMMDRDALDALALRCWPELPTQLGVWPYLAFVRLAETGRLIAMEGDLDGAVTLLIGKLLGAGVGYISDWLEHDQGSITLWHQGEAPPQWCDPASLALDRHFNNDKPVVVNAQLAADRDLTIARLWSCDGRYHLAGVEGRTIKPKRIVKGTCGTVTLNDGRDPQAWLESLCHAGMPHHPVLLAGHRADELRRIARLLKIQWHD